MKVSGRRLLIIDDEPQIGIVMRRIAENCGFEVEITTEADTFKRAYAAFQPDAIILDLAVPGMDGIELLRWLADEGCAASILIASGFGSRVIESAKLLGEARGLTMAGTIAKPMRVAEVRAQLTELEQAGANR